MSKRIWILFALTVFFLNCGCAVKEGIRKGDANAPSGVEAPVTGMEMVHIKGGCYLMGDVFNDPEGGSDEGPVHEVCVDDFYLGKYEVTQGLWEEIMGDNPSRDGSCEDTCPVEKVSWNDVSAFIRALNQRSDTGSYRLPSEAEWEYAARSAGKREKYSGGDDVDRVAWYNMNSGGKLHSVGTKAPNGLGIYDMSGSVWEWVNDWYGNDYYSISPRDNPSGPALGVDRVVRGGCSTGEAYNMRTARRNAYLPETRRRSLGFRLVKVP